MTIEFNKDIIDFRDLTERYDELKDELENLSGKDQGDFGSFDKWVEYIYENFFDHNALVDEITTIKKILDDTAGYGGDVEWQGNWYPLLLIKDSYFSEYVEDLVKDCGDIPSDIPWFIEKHIDWDGVASELQIDYGSIEINDITYWYR